MTEIIWNIKEEDIEWLMPWKSKYNHETKEDEMKFEEDDALAHLLINGVIFLNSNWWKDEWSNEDRESISVNVQCNDIFMWGCSDAEGLPFDEIKNLYRMWRKDPDWGAAVWCMVQRKQMPQKPVEDIIRKASIWDLDSLNLDKF
jgi:hypothetical protein